VSGDYTDLDSHLLPETPCISEPIRYNSVDPGEKIFEKMCVLRILYPQTRWKKPVDSMSSCFQVIKTVVVGIWVYFLCCPQQLDNSNVFERRFLCAHTSLKLALEK